MPPSVLDGNVLALPVAEIVQALPECLEASGVNGRGTGEGKPYSGDCRRLLRWGRRRLNVLLSAPRRCGTFHVSRPRRSVPPSARTLRLRPRTCAAGLAGRSVCS